MKWIWILLAGTVACGGAAPAARMAYSPGESRSLSAESESVRAASAPAPYAPSVAGAPMHTPKPVALNAKEVDADGSMPDQAPPTGGNGGAPPQQPAAEATRRPHSAAMLIYTANLTMAVYQVDPALGEIERIGRDAGGYLASKTDRGITIRVPRARFDEVLKAIEKSGDVIHREVTAQDVTDQFVDLEARLKNARAMRDRLQELLGKANTKEALEIEVQLERVMGEIESMEGRLKLLSDKIAFSTISVMFEPRGNAAVRDMPVRLPFSWLSALGLPRLLSLSEGSP